MPSKKKTPSVASDDFDDEYRLKRDRNNQAVQRSRIKSKERTKKTQERVSDLKVKNQVLEQNIENLTKDLKFLKDLFLAQAQSKAEKLSKEELTNLLKDDDEDVGAGGGSGSSNSRAGPSTSRGSR